jgi:inosine triphosphate pyrophosphatase
MKKKLIIVTGNPLKVRELSNALGDFFDCEAGTLEGYEIQGTPEEILEHKLNRAYEKFKMPVLVDDTSLHFEELNGFPGPYIRDFLRAIPSVEMGKKFVGGRVSLACRLAVMRSPGDVVLGKGEVFGTVVKPKEIDPGIREFDIFIQVDGTDKPMFEFTPEEKNHFSHRGNAVRDLIAKLKISRD